MDKKTFNIGIELDSDFVDCLQNLIDTYGSEMAKLNGFSKEQLNYTDFIDNFIDKKTAADASIDGNANVRSKDIVTLQNEMAKPHSKLLSFNKLYYEMKKKWGKEAADQWLIDEYTGVSYLHDAYNASFLSYCLRGDTEFVTSKGVKTLKEMCGKDVTVLNKNGGWEHGVVKCFGEGELYKITMSYMGGTKIIYATGNHRWFLYDNNGKTEVVTKDLKPGDRIPRVNDITWSRTNLSSFGVAHGFFTGDGYKSRNRANFCGDKIALLPYFQPCNVTGDEREYSVCGCPNYFSELPSIAENKSYLYGWLAGFFAADGCMGNDGKNCVLTSCNYDYIKFARDVVAKLGMPVYDIRTQHRKSNLTNEWGDVYYLTLDKNCLCDDFFIRPAHKEGFQLWKNKKGRKGKKYWIVNSVERTGIVEPVYCVETDNSGSFTLTGGVLTHNCYASDVDRVAKEGLFFFYKGNHAPKHLVTFTDFVVETVSFGENRSSGAFGLPSFLVWSFYFWHKDVADGYYMISPEYYRDQEFQRVVYKLNQPYLRNSVQSAFTNFNIFDHPYFEALFGGVEFPDGTFAIDYEEDIIEYQKAFMKVVSDIRSQEMFTFPVLTFSLLRVDGKFVDESFARWACEHNMKWADSNFYISDSVDSLSSCCRLRNAIKGDDTPYFNSIGGTALNVGSVKVNTLNLARLAYMAKTPEEYLHNIYDATYRDLKLLDVQRHTIERNVEKGLLPNYTSGLVDITKQYSTVGCVGGEEAIEHFGLTKIDEFGMFSYTDEGLELYKNALATIHRAIGDFKKNNDVHYMVNLEQAPAERCAAILMEKDQILYPNEKYDLPLYANQWIALAKKATIQDRTITCGALDAACNGGSIEHINIDAPFNNFETAWNMLNWVANQGVSYFAFCTRISACEDNHGFYGDTCPICGKPVDTTYQRVVGFLTPVKSYSKERKAEFFRRDWMDLNSMEDLR